VSIIISSCFVDSDVEIQTGERVQTDGECKLLILLIYLSRTIECETIKNHMHRAGSHEIQIPISDTDSDTYIARGIITRTILSDCPAASSRIWYNRPSLWCHGFAVSLYNHVILRILLCSYYFLWFINMMLTRAIGLGTTLRKATMNPSLSELSHRVYLNLFTLLFHKAVRNHQLALRNTLRRR